MMRSALVFGGSGTVGREVLKGLATKGIATTFTYFRQEELAKELTGSLGHRAVHLDLSKAEAIQDFFNTLKEEKRLPDIFIHCAGIAGNPILTETTDEDWLNVQAVNCQSGFVAARALAPHFIEKQGGDMVFVGAMDRTQSFELPVAFAATQGMLSGMTMSLAKALGPAQVRVNMLALGILEEGLSRELDQQLLEDYQKFSALRRLGTPKEVSDAILWLALENTYLSGKVIPVNGGI